MICEILAYVQTSMGGGAEQMPKTYMTFMPCIFIGFGVLILIVKWGLIIWGIVWLVKYLNRSKEEKQLLRLELGKLADEIGQIRQELKGTGETLEKEEDND